MKRLLVYAFLGVVAPFVASAELISPDSTDPIPPPDPAHCVVFGTSSLDEVGLPQTLGGVVSALRSGETGKITVGLIIVRESKLMALLPEVELLWTTRIALDDPDCIAEHAMSTWLSLHPEAACARINEILEHERRRDLDKINQGRASRIAYLLASMARKCNVDVSDLAYKLALSKTFNLSAASVCIRDILLPLYRDKMSDEELVKLYSHWSWDRQLAEDIRRASGKEETFFSGVSPARQPPWQQPFQSDELSNEEPESAKK